MNGTIVYSEAQRAVLPLGGFVITPILSAIVYWIARRRIKQDDGETHSSRTHFFYAAATGIMLGQFIGHAKGTNALLAVFVAASYFACHLAEVVRRIYTSSQDTIASPLLLKEDYALDEGSSERRTMIVADPTSEFYSQTTYQLNEDYHEKRTRQGILGGTILTLCALSLVDSLFLIHVHPTTVGSMVQVFVAYFAHGIAMSMAVFATMIHAKYHVTENRRYRRLWWAGVTAVWSVLYGCASSVVVLSDVSWEWVDEVLRHTGLSAFYGCALGVLLWIYHYLSRWRDIEPMSRKTLLLGELVFFSALAHAACTAMALQIVPLL